MDTEAIRPGQEWPNRVRAALAASRYVFVIIGPTWLTAGMSEWGKRRIDNESDWVRLEIAAALGDPQKTVLPVLIRAAGMPPAHALPSDVAAVTTKQAVEIRRDYWDHDVGQVTAMVNATMEKDMVSVNPPAALVDGFWNELSPDLQDAIALAATAARRAGKNVVSTRTLFAAFRRLHPEPLGEFFDHVPPGTLPEALPQSLAIDAGALGDIDSFSSCVQDSLEHLTARSGPHRKLSAADVFVDIAKHGSGNSVHRLRTHGVDVSRVNEIVRQLGWRIMERRNG